MWGYSFSCGLQNRAEFFRPHLGGRPVAVALNHPLPVVAPPEVQQRQAQLLDRLEGPHPEQVLLEGADEALGAAVALGLPHEAGRALDAQKGDLPLEVVGEVGAPVVVAKLEPRGHILLDGAKMFAHPLGDGLQGLEAVAAPGRVDAHALGRAVIHSDKDAGPSLRGSHGGGHVGASHHIGRLGHNRSVMGPRTMGMAHPMGCLKTVLSHQPAHPLLRGANALVPQSHPHLAVALPVEARG